MNFSGVTPGWIGGREEKAFRWAIELERRGLFYELAI
jgi:hypothetical protein